MLTVSSLLDLAKKAQGIQSDYKLAQLLDATQNTVANYRHGRSRPDDKMLSRLGELAKVPPEDLELLAVQLQADRASTEQARQMWTRLAFRLQAGVAHVGLLMIAAISSIAVYSPNAEATALIPSQIKAAVCILCKVTRRAFSWLCTRPIRATFTRFAQGVHHVQSADTDASYRYAA